MRTNRKMWFSVALGIAFVGAAMVRSEQPSLQPSKTPPPPAPAQATKESADSNWPVIGHIESADRRVTIKSGPSGPVYTVKTAAGKTLFENLSAEQLRAKAPDLHQLIKTGVASKADARVKLDATLRTR